MFTESYINSSFFTHYMIYLQRPSKIENFNLIQLNLNRKSLYLCRYQINWLIYIVSIDTISKNSSNEALAYNVMLCKVNCSNLFKTFLNTYSSHNKMLERSLKIYNI